MLFIIINAYFVYKNQYFAVALPLLLGLLYFYFFKFDWIILLVAFVTPISVELSQYDWGMAISVPSEPVLISITLIFIIKLIIEKNNLKPEITHPLSIIAILSLVWMFITSCTSCIPLVSFKALAAQIWILTPVFFIGMFLFKTKKNINLFIWLYSIALIIVVFYTIKNHSGYGFSDNVRHWAMRPFYNDHTAYGAVLALLIPVLVSFFILEKNNKLKKALILIAVVILIMALYLSYSRAAWLSIIVAFGVLIVILLKIKFRWIAVTIGAVLITFFTFQHQILEQLERNKQDSSADFVEHIRSMSNITSDASNLERINRWQAALRMFNEKPFFGFGPRTYQFEYAPYQLKKEKTIISTNFGDLGNAHSEYIGLMAEQGIIGLLLFLALIFYSIKTGINVFRRHPDRSYRLISIGITIGLISYFLHGFLNNFLETDKLAVPFWAFMAILIAMDTDLKKLNETKG